MKAHALFFLLLLGLMVACDTSTTPPPPPPPPEAMYSAAEREERDVAILEILTAIEAGGLKGIDAPEGFLLKASAEEGFDNLLRFETAQLGNLKNVTFAGQFVTDTLSWHYAEIVGEMTWANDTLHYSKFTIQPDGKFGVSVGPIVDAGFRTWEGGHSNWALAKPKSK